MINPRDLVAESVMPAYPWLRSQTLNSSMVGQKMQAMRTLGVPYRDEELQLAADDLRAQQLMVAARLREQGAGEVEPTSELVALISYLQRLGKDVREDKGTIGGLP